MAKYVLALLRMAPDSAREVIVGLPLVQRARLTAYLAHYAQYAEALQGLARESCQAEIAALPPQRAGQLLDVLA